MGGDNSLTQMGCNEMKKAVFRFLDESGLNLHTSNNYGYSQINHEATIYQPALHGKNTALCAIISNNAIEHFKLVEGGYNQKIS